MFPLIRGNEPRISLQRNLARHRPSSKIVLSSEHSLRTEMPCSTRCLINAKEGRVFLLLLLARRGKRKREKKGRYAQIPDGWRQGQSREGFRSWKFQSRFEGFAERSFLDIDFPPSRFVFSVPGIKVSSSSSSSSRSERVFRAAYPRKLGRRIVVFQTTFPNDRFAKWVTGDRDIEKLEGK